MVAFIVASDAEMVDVAVCETSSCALKISERLNFKYPLFECTYTGC